MSASPTPEVKPKKPSLKLEYDDRLTKTHVIMGLVWGEL
jgi:hypothetical protein